MKDVPQLIDKKLLDRTGVHEIGALGVDRRRFFIQPAKLLERRRVDVLPRPAFIPRAAAVDLALIALAR